MSSTRAFDWSTVPFGPGVKILQTHPCGLAALEKPPGILAHPNRAADRTRALLTTAFDENEERFNLTQEHASAGSVWLLHRLDAATSGVVLVTSSAEVATAVRDAFAQRRVTKQYLAIVLGHPRERRAVWRDAMEVRRGAATGAGRGARAAVARNSGGGLRAETSMRVLRLLPGPPALAVLELEPHTGRTHQLRHQCAQRHLPILGDQNYGNFPLNRELARKLGTERLFLHARAVEFEFALAGVRVRFSASSSVPPEFTQVAGRL